MKVLVKASILVFYFMWIDGDLGSECAVQIGDFGPKLLKMANLQALVQAQIPINPHELKYKHACFYKYFHAVCTFSSYMMILQSRFFRKPLFILFRVNDRCEMLRKLCESS
jgi:hypothetical protein